MWATQHLHLLLIPRPLPSHLPLILSARGSQPPRHRSAPLKTGTGSSNPNTRIPEEKQLQQTNKEEERRKEIKGSDVLWALQKAAAKKNRSGGKKGKKIRMGKSKSPEAEGEEDCLDYSKVRPIRIKSEWSIKLDELEKRAKELHDT